MLLSLSYPNCVLLASQAQWKYISVGVYFSECTLQIFIAKLFLYLSHVALLELFMQACCIAVYHAVPQLLFLPGCTFELFRNLMPQAWRQSTWILMLFRNLMPQAWRQYLGYVIASQSG